MGNTIKKINFDDMLNIVNKNQQIPQFLIINVLEDTNQVCLIKNTIPASMEETIINKYIKENINIHIVIYGKNCCDEKIHTKYKQLLNLGFKNLYLYVGGLFEWLLLQDIYGNDIFETTNGSTKIDMLMYKPASVVFYNV